MRSFFFLLLGMPALGAVISQNTYCSDGPAMACPGATTSASTSVSVADPFHVLLFADAAFTGPMPLHERATSIATYETEFLVNVAGTGLVGLRPCITLVTSLPDSNSLGSRGLATALVGSRLFDANSSDPLLRDPCSTFVPIQAGLPTTVHVLLTVSALGSSDSARNSSGFGRAAFNGFSVVDAITNQPLDRALTITEVPEPGTIAMVMIGIAAVSIWPLRNMKRQKALIHSEYRPR